MRLVNPEEIFLKNRRFDLIFKLLYLKYHNLYKSRTNFFEDLYCEHIRAFNGFSEKWPSDGIPKNSKEKFLTSFNENFYSIKNYGFDREKSVLYLGEEDELYDGSHRLAICTLLNINAYAKKKHIEQYYDYKFFNAHKIDSFYADYAVLEYIKFNPNAYVVNLHSVTDPSMDSIVESVLWQYGFIYFKKEIGLTFNGYVNIKKLSYGFDNEDTDLWIGNSSNDFAGAKYHADNSKGNHPLRIYIFVCDNIEKVKTAKQKIREIYNIGNFSVHINDTHEEAIALAQTYFNKNSLFVLNNRPYNLISANIDDYIKEVKRISKYRNIDLDTFCAVGSTPLDVLGIRKCMDFDILNCAYNNIEFTNPNISCHDSELNYYPVNKIEIIMNPRYHFYYKGFKFITLSILSEMKKNRNEKPKDMRDVILITRFLNIKKNINNKIFTFLIEFIWIILRKVKRLSIK